MTKGYFAARNRSIAAGPWRARPAPRNAATRVHACRRPASLPRRPERNRSGSKHDFALNIDPSFLSESLQLFGIMLEGRSRDEVMEPHLACDDNASTADAAASQGPAPYSTGSTFAPF